jgi:hypothetical protein
VRSRGFFAGVFISGLMSRQRAASAAEAGQLKSSGIPPAPETISDVLEPRC